MKYTFLLPVAFVALCACNRLHTATTADNNSINHMRDSIVAAERIRLADSLEMAKRNQWPLEHKEELKQLFYQTLNDKEMDYDTLEYASGFDFDHDGSPDCIVRFVFAEEYKSPKKYYSSVLFTYKDQVTAIEYDEFQHDMTIFDGGKVSVYIPLGDTTFYTVHHAVRNGKIEKTVEYDNMNIDYINDTIHYRNFQYQPLFK